MHLCRLRVIMKRIIKICLAACGLTGIILLCLGKWKILGIWLAIIVLFLSVLSIILEHFALDRHYFVTLGQFFDVTTEINEPKFKAGRKYFNKAEEWEMRTEDDLTLKALMIPGTGHDWVILCHGYASDLPEAMSGYGLEYFRSGWNALMPQARAHANSDGRWIGMGWKEREDILKWIERIRKLDPEARIVLHGVSMGGAAVLNVAGENPEGVIAVIDDCGYTSVWDEFAWQLKELFGLPPFPILYIADLFARKHLKGSCKEASPLEQVKKTKIPVLFIHGRKDEFVPYEMGRKNANACTSFKEFVTVDDASHANSVYKDPDYGRRVLDFIKKCEEI